MHEDSLLRDEHFESRLLRGRLHFLIFVVLLALTMLVLRYHNLQIEQFQRFTTLSDDNRIHVRAIPPTRGLIFDREGVLLAENRPSYTLSIVPEQVPDIDELIEKLSETVAIGESDLVRFREQLSQKRRPYEAIPLRYKLNEEEVARFSVREFDLPGANIQTELIRYYPQAEYFAHVVGYVGRINEQDQTRIDAKAYAGTHVIGKTGIERQYEDQLLGKVGYEYVETDARGNVLRILEQHHATPGENVYLNLDARLQASIQDRLEGERAAVVVLDTQGSGVLALVSTPSFDPNLFVSGISSKDYNALVQDPSKPLFNRVLQGQYAPGSTIKPMFGLIALQTQSISPTFSVWDPGFFILPGQSRPYRDWKAGGHGRVDLTRAIVESCDTFFYEAGNRTGVDALSSYGSQFGFGHRTDIDLPGEQPGIMPSRIWKQGARGIAWYPGDTINLSIGQGFLLATPMQLAQSTAIIARRGQVMTPKVVAKIGEQVVLSPVTHQIEIKSSYWDLVTSAMRDVVHSPRGTANAVGRGLTAYEIAGKSGTAQVISVAQDVKYDDLELEKRLRDNALFVAYAPAQKPQLATGIIVENGEHGSSMAAPIARAIFDKWFELNPSALTPPAGEHVAN